MSDLTAVYYPLQLPSRCLVYKDIIKDNSQEQIKIRAFKGKDEKLVAEISTENFEKKFQQILKNVLIGIEPSKLTVGDRQFLMLWETINSYDKLVSITHECEHCWQKSDFSVDLSLLEVNYLPENFVEPYDVELPISKVTVKLRLLRLEDMANIDELVKLGKNVWLYRYALSLVNSKTVWENVEYLENLDTQDLTRIRAFHDKFDHGIKMEFNYTCPKCGGTGLMPVPFRLEMLLPYGKAITKYLRNPV